MRSLRDAAANGSLDLETVSASVLQLTDRQILSMLFYEMLAANWWQVGGNLEGAYALRWWGNLSAVQKTALMNGYELTIGEMSPAARTHLMEVAVRSNAYGLSDLMERARNWYGDEMHAWVKDGVARNVPAYLQPAELTEVLPRGPLPGGIATAKKNVVEGVVMGDRYGQPFLVDSAAVLLRGLERTRRFAPAELKQHGFYFDMGNNVARCVVFRFYSRPPDDEFKLVGDLPEGLRRRLIGDGG